MRQFKSRFFKPEFTIPSALVSMLKQLRGLHHHVILLKVQMNIALLYLNSCTYTLHFSRSTLNSLPRINYTTPLQIEKNMLAKAHGKLATPEQ